MTPRAFALAVTAHSTIVNLNRNRNRNRNRNLNVNVNVNVNDTGTGTGTGTDTAAHVCIDCQSPPLGYIAAMALAVLQGLSISV